MNNIPIFHPQIPGLVNWCDTTNNKYFKRVKDDVYILFKNYIPHKNSKHGRRRMSRYIQIGTSSVDADDGCFRYISEDNSKFNNILNYIARIHAQYENYVMKMTNSKIERNNYHNLNVMIREYQPGQSIGYHTDRKYLDSMIWSLIIECEDDGICFQDPNTKNKYKIKESPGLIMVQTGDSRYYYKHGVDSVKSKRISITWRFFNKTDIMKLSGYDKSLKRMPNFVDKVKKLRYFEKYNDMHYSSSKNPLLPEDISFNFDDSSSQIGNKYKENNYLQPEDQDSVLFGDNNPNFNFQHIHMVQSYNNSNETRNYSLFSCNNSQQLPILTTNNLNSSNVVIKPPIVSKVIVGMITDFPNLIHQNSIYKCIGNAINEKFKGNSICFVLLKVYENNENFQNMIQSIKCDEVNIQISYIDKYDDVFLKSNVFISFSGKLKEINILDYIIQERHNDLIRIPALKAESFQIVNTYGCDFDKFTPFEINVLTKSDLRNETHKDFISQIIGNFIYKYNSNS